MVCKTRNGYQHRGISPWVTRLQHKGCQGFYSTDNAGFCCSGINARARTGMICSEKLRSHCSEWRFLHFWRCCLAPLAPGASLPCEAQGRHNFVSGEQTPLFLSFSAAPLFCEGTIVSPRGPNFPGGCLEPQLRKMQGMDSGVYRAAGAPHWSLWILKSLCIKQSSAR